MINTNIRTIRRSLIGGIIILSCIIIIVSPKESREDNKQEKNKNSLPIEIENTVENFFHELGTYRVTGKEPSMTACTMEGMSACKDVFRKKFSKREFLLASYTGEVKDLAIELSGNLFLATFNYYSTLEHSLTERMLYPDEERYYYDRDFFEAYLIRDKEKNTLQINNLIFHNDAEISAEASKALNE